MQTLNPYVLKAQSAIFKLAKNESIQYILYSTVIIFAFIIGRAFHERKFTPLLNLINDAESARKKLSQESAKRSNSQTNLMSKIKYIKILSIIAIILLALQTYLVKFNFWLTAGVCGTILLVSGLVWWRLRYLSWKKLKIDSQLKKNSINAENEVHQILTLLGPEVGTTLKGKFERQIDAQWRTQEIKQCDLFKCHEQKRVTNQLYQLCKTILSEMQKMAWCEICSSKSNANANQIKINEIQNNIKIYVRAIEDGDKMPIERRKQLTNRLLNEWKNLEERIPFICKRGCCVKFRTCLDQIKLRHHNKLKLLKSQLP